MALKTPSKFVTPPLGEDRLSRQWSSVRARLNPPRPRRPWVVGGGLVLATAAAVTLAFLLVRPRAALAPVADGAVLESGPHGGGTSFTLPEGTQVVLGDESRARLTAVHPGSVRIELERGSVDIEAPHVEGRSFAVAAAGFEVRVVGTHFSVERLPLAVQVRVTRGEVEVAGPDGSTRRVRAGESWAAQLGQSASVTSPPSPPPAAPAIDPSPPMAPAPVVAPSVPVETAKSLFEDAQGARADGRPADAARALDKLRRTYRTDPRAGLSAFELGRLRLDALSDPRGAEEALRDAVALAPTSPFREDAEARIVQARARMGDRSGCAAARDTYLLRYPRGVYRNAVGVYCTGQ